MGEMLITGHTTAERIRIEQDFDSLLEISERCKTSEHIQLVRKAFEVADEAHKEQRRKTTGEPYIHHPIAVAKIIGKLGLGPKTIAAALLHDVVEDNPAYTLDFIKETFGGEIATMVDGLTKIPEARTNADESVQIATFRHLLRTIPTNIRTVFVKIADRLHNMNTMEGMHPRTQQVKASEALQVYVPIAKRLGLYSIKNQLEDLSFKYINSEIYNSIESEVLRTAPQRDMVFEDLQKKIDRILAKENNIDYEIKRRQKSNYSAYKLMQNKNLPFSDIEEFMSLRIVFQPNGLQSERIQAWSIYSLITDELTNNNSMLKDYTHEIMLNGYRALHCTLLGCNHQWIQVQILSRRWELISESGFIIDRQYTENNIRESKLGEWIESLNDSLESATTNKEFLQAIETDMFVSPIQCFTPKGKIINLPTNATVLDFAFHVHTDLGLHCAAAIVNFKRVGRDYKLKNSDRVEIVTKPDQLPESNWMQIVITPKARNSLKNFYKKEEQKQMERGRLIFQETIDLQGIELEQSLLQKIYHSLNTNSEDELYQKIGAKVLTVNDLQREIRRFTRKSWLPRFFGSAEEEVDSKPLEINPKKPFFLDDTIDESRYSLASCCNPIGGDRSIAFKSPRGLIIIHRTKCAEAQRISATHGKKIAQVEWAPNMKRTFLTKIKIDGYDRDNLLSDVLAHLKRFEHINLRAVDMKGNEGVFTGIFSLQVKNSDYLKAIIKDISQVEDIKEVVRLEKI